MDVYNIKDFKNGWFIGNFEPSLFKTNDFEIAKQSFKKGHKGDAHFHKVATEINCIVRGKIQFFNMFGVKTQVLKTGDIFVFNPNQISYVEFLANTDLIVVKYPFAHDDKYNTNEE